MKRPHHANPASRPMWPARATPARVLLGVLAVGVAATGCARTIIAHPLDTGYPPGSVADELAFLDAISARTAVTNDEGLHALFTLADGADQNRTYADRVDQAKRRGWVGAGWDEQADLAMERGTLARSVVVLCGIQGGVMLRVLGPTGRYATRELVYLSILPQGTENQTISGRELVGVLNKAQDYLHLQAAAGAKDAAAGGRGRPD